MTPSGRCRTVRHTPRCGGAALGWPSPLGCRGADGPRPVPAGELAAPSPDDRERLPPGVRDQTGRRGSGPGGCPRASASSRRRAPHGQDNRAVPDRAAAPLHAAMRRFTPDKAVSRRGHPPRRPIADRRAGAAADKRVTRPAAFPIVPMG